MSVGGLGDNIRPIGPWRCGVSCDRPGRCSVSGSVPSAFARSFVLP